LEFAERRDGDRLVLGLAGELDLATATLFNDRVGAVLQCTENVVVLDLRDLEFVDSAGLHCLLNAHRRLTRQARRLQVVCSDGPVWRAIRLARLVETLGVELHR
jgi:anti-anti-sigma factor